MKVLAELSAWAFGWDALVAIGTLCLATATIALALKTAALARATAADIASQDRPVLVPAAQGKLEYTAASFEAEIINAGKGVALDIQASALLDDTTTAPDTWNKAALAPAETITLTFSQLLLLTAGTLVLHLQYRDIADNVHTSEIIVDFHRDPRTGNGTRRYADTIIDGVATSPDAGRHRSQAGRESTGAGAHPASRAIVTDRIQAWRRRRTRRWVLK